MSKIAPVTQQKHGHKHWQRFTSYSFTSTTQYAPLVSAELQRAMQAMPLAFVRQKEGVFLVAILGISPGENVFVNQRGQWMGGYIPSCFRSYPFKLCKVAQESKMILCIDEDSGLISEEQGEPFFDENGDLARPTRQVMDFLTNVEQNRPVTQKAVDALDKAGVLTPWQPKVRVGDEDKEIAGLFRIDEDKLNTLDDNAFLLLRTAQAIPVAYAQIFSMGNIGILKKLAELQIREKQPNASQADIEMFLGQDDMIRFDE